MAATVNYILSSEALFRAGIISHIIGQALFTLVPLFLYKILRIVNKTHALLMTVLILIAIPIVIINELNRCAILLLLNGAETLQALDTDQLYSQVMFYLDLHEAGIHFALLYSAFTGKIRLFWRSTVLRFYILFLFFGVLFSTLDLYYRHNTEFFTALRYAAFNIISVGTSTGFATTDTSIWPGFSQLILIFFALQCACSGSTSGGIKVDRIVIVLKSFIKQIKLVMHPRAIIPIRIDGRTINEDINSKSILYVMIYMIIVFISSALLSLMGVDLISAFSGTVAAIANVGPGLGAVGSIGNFSHIPVLGKWLLTITMLLGRLEIYALFIFLTPAQWRETVSY